MTTKNYTQLIQDLKDSITRVQNRWATADRVSPDKKTSPPATSETEQDLTTIQTKFNELQKLLQDRIELVSTKNLTQIQTTNAAKAAKAAKATPPTATALLANPSDVVAAVSAVQTSTQLLQKTHSVQQLLSQYIKIKGNPSEFETPFLLDALGELKETFVQSEPDLKWHSSTATTTAAKGTASKKSSKTMNVPENFGNSFSTNPSSDGFKVYPPCYLTVPQMQELIDSSLDHFVAESLADEKKITLPSKPEHGVRPAEPVHWNFASETCDSLKRMPEVEERERKEVSFDLKEKRNLLKQLFVSMFLRRGTSATCSGKLSTGKRKTGSQTQQVCSASRKEQVLAEIRGHRQKISEIGSVVQDIQHSLTDPCPPAASDPTENGGRSTELGQEEKDTVQSAVQLISQTEKEVRDQQDKDFDSLLTRMQRALWTDRTDEFWDSEALMDLQIYWQKQLDLSSNAFCTYDNEEDQEHAAESI
jgi:hypothetical protein